MAHQQHHRFGRSGVACSSIGRLALVVCSAVLLASCAMVRVDGPVEPSPLKTEHAAGGTASKKSSDALTVKFAPGSETLTRQDTSTQTGSASSAVESPLSAASEPSIAREQQSSLKILPESPGVGKSAGAVGVASVELKSDSTAQGVTQAAGVSVSPDPAIAALPSDAAQATLAEVLQYTLNHHPLLRVRQHEVEEARGRLITAGILPNPQWVMDTESPLEQAGPMQLTTRLTFTIPTGPKRRLQAAAAQARISRMKHALSRETRTVLVEAIDAATEVLYLQELVALNQRMAKLAAQVAEAQRERFKLAAVQYRNVVQADLAASRLELDRRTATTQLDQARVRLSRAMGLATGSPPPLEGQLSVEPLLPISLEDVLAQARRVAPDLAEGQAAVAESRQKLAAEQWKAVPDLTIGPRSQTSLGEPSGPRLGARVSVDLPLFDRNQGVIAETAAQVGVRRAQLALAEVTAMNDVAALYTHLKDVQSQWDYYATQVRPLLVQTEAAIREAAQDRTISIFELLDLLQLSSRMQLNELEMRYLHQSLRTRLEMFLDCPLSGPAVKSPELIPTPPKAPITPDASQRRTG